ncbi:MAG: TetR/AcrR family transcriptional regulator [Cyanobacteriota bacterium]|nr:TetR/AcrR family transcriptional regulator [Cyanobacteriota bacterium]
MKEIVERIPDLKEHRLISQKRVAILTGAKREFLAHGYAATSVDRIAARAGVSKSTLYSHFKDKEALFSALIQQIAQDKLRSITESAILDRPLRPDLALRQIAQTMVGAITEAEGEMVQFMRVLLGEAGRFPELAKLMVENLEKPGFAMISHFLASYPELNIVDPEATARVFVGSLVHFVLIQEGMYGKEIIPMPMERLIDCLVSLIVPFSPQT